jgi:hypothetical protein
MYHINIKVDLFEWIGRNKKDLELWVDAAAKVYYRRENNDKSVALDAVVEQKDSKRARTYRVKAGLGETLVRILNKNAPSYFVFPWRKASIEKWLNAPSTIL